MFNNVQKGRNMTTTILRLPAVCTQRALSRSSVYLQIQDGLFPPPINTGTRAVGWPAVEVDAINRARISGKSDDQIRTLVLGLITARQSLA